MTDELLDGPVSASAPPPDLDPPFRGYIETTYDSLLVFEAARRGMIPRVTRRLIERERGMVQSGAVFVFDEHESGIKRWTDGLIWSPSRILGNFLVYRETDKKPIDGTPSRSSPPGRLMGPPGTYAESSRMAAMGASPALAQGAMRPRSVSETDGMDRNKERQLVGSLTNSYKFKKGGLVKKTMSVTVAGYSQHMISYYTVEDVLNGKLRAPSTIPELAALDISPDYLSKQNFRFPPLVEVGPDGIPRYRGEGEEPGSPSTPMSNMSFSQPDYDQYGYAAYEPTRGHGHSRAITVHSPHLISPMPLSPPPGAMSASYSQSSYFDQSPAGLQRTGSNPALRPAPGSGSRRYDPYGQSAPAPRTGGLNGSIGGGHSRRMSIPQTNGDYYNQQGYEQFDVKPIILPDGQAMYQGPPPPLTSSAPSTYADYYAQSAPPSAAPGSAMIPGPASGPGSGIYLPSPSGMRHTLPPLPPLPPLSTVPGSAQPHHSPSYPTSSSNWPGSAPIQMPPLPSQGRHGHSHSHSAHPPPPPLQHPHPHSHPGHPGLLSMPSPSAREYALTPISAPNGPASAPPPLPLPPMSPIQQAPDGYHGYSMPPPPASAPVGSHHLHQHQHSHHSLGHQLPPPLHVPASPQQPQSQSRSQQHTQMPDQPHPHHQQQHQQQAALGLDGQGQNQGQGQGGSMPAWSPTHASHSHAAPPPPGPPGYQNPSGSSAEWRAPMA